MAEEGVGKGIVWFLLMQCVSVRSHPLPDARMAYFGNPSTITCHRFSGLCSPLLTDLPMSVEAANGMCALDDSLLFVAAKLE